MKHRRSWLIGLGLLVLVACLFWVMGAGGPAPARPDTSGPTHDPIARSNGASPAPSMGREPGPRTEDTSRRTTAPATVPVERPTHEPAPPTTDLRPPPASPPPSTRSQVVPDEGLAEVDPPLLRDRIGLDPELMKAISRELLPLTDECIEDARERDPALEGMLAVEVSVVVDPEVGAVVDMVDFAERNEIADQELQTCVRETALSMLLPADEEAAQELLFTIPIEAETETETEG